MCRLLQRHHRHHNAIRTSAAPAILAYTPLSSMLTNAAAPAILAPALLSAMLTNAAAYICLLIHVIFHTVSQLFFGNLILQIIRHRCHVCSGIDKITPQWCSHWSVQQQIHEHIKPLSTAVNAWMISVILPKQVLPKCCQSSDRL